MGLLRAKNPEVNKTPGGFNLTKLQCCSEEKPGVKEGSLGLHKLCRGAQSAPGLEALSWRGRVFQLLIPLSQTHWAHALVRHKKEADFSSTYKTMQLVGSWLDTSHGWSRFSWVSNTAAHTGFLPLQLPKQERKILRIKYITYITAELDICYLCKADVFTMSYTGWCVEELIKWFTAVITLILLYGVNCTEVQIQQTPLNIPNKGIQSQPWARLMGEGWYTKGYLLLI